ncbi:MAG: hypothetical protein HRU19_06770 [Pseudobacteriovorax sp.]|nr:hypothetical protein [Pseudobacteriovorax sp.]
MHLFTKVFISLPQSFRLLFILSSSVCLLWVLTNSYDQAFGSSDIPMKPSITIVYQKDCLSCRKLFGEIPCLRKLGWNIELIGVGSDKLALMQEARRVSELPPKIISFKEASAMGIRGTPSILVGKSPSRPNSLISGYYSCQDLKRRITP